MDENKTQPNNTDQNIKTIHTYTSDMADAVRNNETTVIKIALAEKDKRDREDVYKKAEGTPTSKFFLAFGGIILLVGAGIGLYFLIQKNNIASAPQQVTKAPEAIISYDEQVFIDLSNATSSTSLVDAIKGDIVKKAKPGSIKSLSLTKTVDGKSQVMTINNLLSLIKVTAPATLIRTLGDQYMVGVYASKDPHLFLILSIKDFNQAYAAMLEWEKTMLDDMFILFNINVSGTRSTLFERPWKDIIINNKDARILYDADGNDVLFYIFADKNDLIITDSQEAIKEISLRLLTKNTKPL